MVPAAAAAGGRGNFAAPARNNAGGGRNNNNNNNASSSAAVAPPPPKQLFDSGNVSLTYSGAFPDWIKLIKQIKVHPLVFTATGAINPRTRKRFVNFSVRETFFNGAFICHVSRKSLEYR